MVSKKILGVTKKKLVTQARRIINGKKNIYRKRKRNKDEFEDKYGEYNNTAYFDLILKKQIYNSLTLDFVEKIACREFEISQIKSCFNVLTSKKANKFIFIGGCPGSGKTLVVKALLQEYKAQIQSHFINFRKTENPKEFLDNLTSKITNNTKKKLNDLPIWFSRQKTKKPIVIVLDEVDQISNSIKVIFKPLLDLLFNSNLRFTLIGISNDINFLLKINTIFPECINNLLSIIFPAYTSDDLVQIINSRMNFSPSIISENAKQYLAKNISASGGDSRKLFSILKNVFDIFFEKNKDTHPYIDLPDIVRSTKNADQSISQIVVESNVDISLPQWFVFLTFLRLIKRSKSNIDPNMIYSEYNYICQQNKIDATSSQDFKYILENLEVYGLIKINKKKSGLNTVNLAVSLIEAKTFLTSQKLKNSVYDRLLAA